VTDHFQVPVGSAATAESAKAAEATATQAARSNARFIDGLSKDGARDRTAGSVPCDS
jgi:hypothetical protein